MGMVTICAKCGKRIPSLVQKYMKQGDGCKWCGSRSFKSYKTASDYYESFFDGV